jgi:hypothetical protein
MDIRRPARDSKGAPPVYQSRVLPLSELVRFPVNKVVLLHRYNFSFVSDFVLFYANDVMTEANGKAK